MKKINPYLKQNKVEARVSNAEMQIVLEKAMLYTKGNVSKFVRLAVLNFKPVKKDLVK